MGKEFVTCRWFHLRLLLSFSIIQGHDEWVNCDWEINVRQIVGNGQVAVFPISLPFVRNNLLAAANYLIPKYESEARRRQKGSERKFFSIFGFTEKRWKAAENLINGFLFKRLFVPELLIFHTQNLQASLRFRCQIHLLIRNHSRKWQELLLLLLMLMAFASKSS